MGAWPALTAPFLLIWAFILVGMIAGIRAAPIANYICCATALGILAPGRFSQGAADSVAIGLSLAAVILPFLSDGQARFLLAALLSSIYIDSGLHKLLSPMWFSGFGIAAPLGLPSLVWNDMAWTAVVPAALWKLGSWSVIGFELLFPFWYAWSRTSLLALTSGILMHLGIAVMYPIPIFSALMISIYAGLLPARFYTRLEGWFKPPRGECALPLNLGRAGIAIWLVFVGAAYATQKVKTDDSIPNFLMKVVRRGIYVTTGVSSHEVFADGLFSRYRHQIRLVFPEAGIIVPYSRGNLFSLAVRDKLWEEWWKRTQAPWTLLPDAGARLARWANAYRPEGDREGDVVMEARSQATVMDHLDMEVFTRNNEAAWIPVGTIRQSATGEAQVMWTYPTKSGERLVGEYLERVLAEHRP